MAYVIQVNTLNNKISYYRIKIIKELIKKNDLLGQT